MQIGKSAGNVEKCGMWQIWHLAFAQNAAGSMRPICLTSSGNTKITCGAVTKPHPMKSAS